MLVKGRGNENQMKGMGRERKRGMKGANKERDS